MICLPVWGNCSRFLNVSVWGKFSMIKILDFLAHVYLASWWVCVCSSCFPALCSDALEKRNSSSKQEVNGVINGLEYSRFIIAGIVLYTVHSITQL